MKRDQIRKPLLDDDSRNDDSRNYPKEIERTRFRRNRKAVKEAERDS